MPQCECQELMLMFLESLSNAMRPEHSLLRVESGKCNSDVKYNSKFTSRYIAVYCTPAQVVPSRPWSTNAVPRMNLPNSNTPSPHTVLRSQLGRIGASINTLANLQIATVAPEYEQLRDAQVRALVALAEIEKADDDATSAVSIIATSKSHDLLPEEDTETMSDGSSSSFDSGSPFCWLRIEFYRKSSFALPCSQPPDCRSLNRALNIQKQTSSISKCPFGSSTSEITSSSTNIPFFFSLHGSRDEADNECRCMPECKCELFGCARVSLMDGVQCDDSKQKFLLFWATPNTHVEQRAGYRSWSEAQQRRARADIMYNHLAFHGIHSSKKSATDYAARIMHVDHEISLHVDGGQMYTLVI